MALNTRSDHGARLKKDVFSYNAYLPEKYFIFQHQTESNTHDAG